MKLQITKEVSTKNGIIPNWVKEAQYHFINEYGEDYYAFKDKYKLHFTGCEFAWEVFELSLDQVKNEIKRIEFNIENKVWGMILDYKQYKKMFPENKNPLMNFLFNECETYWLLSVLKASLLSMEYYEAKKKEEEEGVKS